MTLSNETIQNIRILHNFTWVLLLVVPIILVWRWNLVGVLLGTIADEIIAIISDLVTLKIRSQEIDYEDWELWRIIWIYMLFYCCFVLFIKFFIIVLLPPE